MSRQVMGQEAPSSSAPAAPCPSRNICRERPGPWAGAAALGLEVGAGPWPQEGDDAAEGKGRSHRATAQLCQAAQR